MVTRIAAEGKFTFLHPTQRSSRSHVASVAHSDATGLPLVIALLTAVQPPWLSATVVAPSSFSFKRGPAFEQAVNSAT